MKYWKTAMSITPKPWPAAIGRSQNGLDLPFRAVKKSKFLNSTDLSLDYEGKSVVVITVLLASPPSEVGNKSYSLINYYYFWCGVRVCEV